MKEIICPDCGVEPGHLHKADCDVEQCADCGGQRLSCACRTEQSLRPPWTGEWPGVEVCREFGWFSRRAEGNGWVPCAQDMAGATEDLNRLHKEARWDRGLRRFVQV